jgi:hypothetical protein
MILCLLKGQTHTGTARHICQQPHTKNAAQHDKKFY